MSDNFSRADQEALESEADFYEQEIVDRASVAQGAEVPAADKIWLCWCGQPENHSNHDIADDESHPFQADGTTAHQSVGEQLAAKDAEIERLKKDFDELYKCWEKAVTR